MPYSSDTNDSSSLESEQVVKPIVVQAAQFDPERYPDLNGVRTAELRQGPKARRVAKWTAIKNRHTGENHHYSLQIITERKKQGTWGYDPLSSVSITTEDNDEVGRLYDFLTSVRADTGRPNQNYLLLHAHADEDAADALQRVVDVMSESGKADAVATILAQVNSQPALLTALIKRAEQNPQLFAEAAAALNLVRYRKAFYELNELIEKTGVLENELQKHLEANPWMFGSEYSMRLNQRKFTRNEQVDFMLRRTTDEYIEAVEIKTPLNGKPLFREDKSHSTLFAGPELSAAIGQVESYIEELDADRHRIFMNDNLDTNKIRAKIVIGRSLDATQVAMLRRFNGHLHRIEVLTFDQLMHIADSVISYIESALEPA